MKRIKSVSIITGLFYFLNIILVLANDSGAVEKEKGFAGATDPITPMFKLKDYTTEITEPLQCYT